jgi:hypothetical protein
VPAQLRFNSSLQSWIPKAPGGPRVALGAFGYVTRQLGLTALIGLALVGCGSSYPESEYPSAPPPGVTGTEEDLTPAPPGAMWRRDVVRVLDAGLGRFLQRVDVEPRVDQGNFVGFRIVELRPPSFWQGIDLLPGDIVTRVNGMPIEQPTEAHDAFQSLRKADKLTVSYVRSDAPRELSYTILDKPLQGPTPSSSASR